MLGFWFKVGSWSTHRRTSFSTPWVVAAAHSAASKEYCSFWFELAGEWLWRCCALRAPGRSLKIDCQLSYIQATVSCRQQNSREVFCQTWSLWEPVYSPLWALNKSRLARYYPRVFLPTCVSICKNRYCPSRLSVSEWTCSVRAVRDNWVADYYLPGVNGTCHITYRRPIAVSPCLLALAGLIFLTNLLVLWPTVTIRWNWFIGYVLASELQCNGWCSENLSSPSFYLCAKCYSLFTN